MENVKLALPDDFCAEVLRKKPVEEVVMQLKTVLMPYVLQQCPFLRRDGLIVFYGSILRGEAMEGSDVDLSLILPLVLRSVYLHSDCLERLRRELHTRNISLELPFIFEEAEDPHILWNRDLLVNILHGAKIIHDPRAIGEELIEKVECYPDVVRRDKMLSAYGKFRRWLPSMERAASRGNILDRNLFLGKLLKLTLMMIHLLHGRVYNERYIYLDVVRSKVPAFEQYQELVVQAADLARENRGECTCAVLILFRSVVRDAKLFGWLPHDVEKMDLDECLKTKYKVETKRL